MTIGNLSFALMQIVTGMAYPGWMMPIAVMAAVAGLLVGAAYGLRHGLRDMVILVLVPLILVIAGSILYGPILLFRGLIGILPAYYVLIAGAISGASTRAGRYIGQGTLIVFLVVGLGYGLLHNFGYDKSNREIARPAFIQDNDIVIHLNDFTILNWMVQGGHNYRMDTGCPNEPGALTPAARDAIKMQLINASRVPDPYYLVAALGPLSSACDEQIINQLAAGAEVVYLRETPILKEVIYKINDN